jgi:MarR family transcriptional regulator, organic hydroperoxide resistance regulator
MASSQAPLAPIEKHLQAFLGALGTDVDSQAAVFNLDHAWMDVQATMEGLALRPHDLTHAGFVLLMTLWITGPRETRELAAVLRVTKGAIVGSVNTLERRGLVERERSMIDKRLVTVQLTSEGRALITRVQKEWRALEVEVTSALTVAEKRTLAGLCRKVGESARAVRKRHGSVPALPDPHEFLNETTTNGTPAKARAG